MVFWVEFTPLWGLFSLRIANLEYQGDLNRKMSERLTKIVPETLISFPKSTLLENRTIESIVEGS